MFSSIPQSAIPLIIGIIVFTIMEMLRVLSVWKQSATKLHQLKYDTHSLRLRLKRQSAERIVAEERHRASFSNQLAA
ncbi:MAG: hypothetical protein IT430_15320 [Phycisphaerales bacterium]|nr:hypothetical protein [Phycisphaerales bacterium]